MSDFVNCSSVETYCIPRLSIVLSKACTFVRAVCEISDQNRVQLELRTIVLTEQHYIPQPTGGAGTLCSQQNLSTASRMELTKFAPLSCVNRLNTREAQV